MFSEKCPQCSLGRLEWVDFIRATCVDDQGKRYPDSWTYFKCDRCEAKLKIFSNGKIEDCGNEEWSWNQPSVPKPK